MSDFGTHWCNTCRRFVTIDGNLVCPLCNRSFLQDLNELDDPCGQFYEVTQCIREHHGPAISEAASRRRFHLTNTTVDDIFNREDHLHGLRRKEDMMDSNAHQEPRMDDTFDSIVSQVEDDQIDHSNHPALPSDSSNSTTSDSLQKVRFYHKHVKDDLKCAICIDRFQLGHELWKMPCKHMFHHDCIVLWLAQHNSCPICRSDMRPQPTWWKKYAFSSLRKNLLCFRPSKE